MSEKGLQKWAVIVCPLLTWLVVFLVLPSLDLDLLAYLVALVVTPTVLVAAVGVPSGELSFSEMAKAVMGSIGIAIAGIVVFVVLYLAYHPLDLSN